VAFPGFPISWISLGGAGAVCLAMFCGVSAAAAQGNPVEYAVKATYLYKFAPFVEWPQSAALEPAADLTLCVVGDDAFGAVLEQAVRGQRVDTHSLTVRRLTVLTPDAGCRVAFLSGPQLETNLAIATGTPILTVTDGAPSATVRGIINFVIENNRVRFQIDNEAALKNGLVISSKLLSLAVR